MSLKLLNHRNKPLLGCRNRFHEPIIPHIFYKSEHKDSRQGVSSPPVPKYALGSIFASEVKRDSLSISQEGTALDVSPLVPIKMPSIPNMPIFVLFKCSTCHYLILSWWKMRRMPYYIWFDTLRYICVFYAIFTIYSCQQKHFLWNFGFCSRYPLWMAALILLSDLHNTPICADSWLKQNCHLDDNITNCKPISRVESSVIWTSMVTWKLVRFEQTTTAMLSQLKCCS